ncbi:MAG: Mov34/MPN/PAD-1 family protein, partial [Candidatus Diapherotrites archaeon]|nr:Mov34/MPN/PAD-1 family protein [Candidatus Diapherotrites archaeon]
GEAFSSLRSDLIPFDSRIVGTIHSHPSGKGHPSSEDLNAFSRMGSIHLIAYPPFEWTHFNAFNA